MFPLLCFLDSIVFIIESLVGIYSFPLECYDTHLRSLNVCLYWTVLFTLGYLGTVIWQ